MAGLRAEKDQLGYEVTREKFCYPERLKLGQKFAQSAMNWARLHAKVHLVGSGWCDPAQPHAGADPERLRKLVEAGRTQQGARAFDRFKGAMAWQASDLTYQLTGKHEGRVIWSFN